MKEFFCKQTFHFVFGWAEVENTIPDAVVTDHEVATINSQWH